MGGWVFPWLVGWLNCLLGVNGWTAECGWLGGWVDGWLDEWLGECLVVFVMFG